MNILITGGTGLIGRALINATLDKHQFSVVSRNVNSVLTHFPEACTEGKVAHINLDTLQDLNDFDAVINLAGEPIADKRWSDKQKQTVCHSRWDITQQLVDLFKASSTPPEVLISGSAIGVYGRQEDTKIDESFTDFHDEFSREICQRWEDIALQAASVTRVCLLRTGVVLSKDGGALGKMLLPFKLGLGGPVSTGTQGFSWIHIDDMVAGIEHLLTTPDAQGPFNFTAPQPVSNAEFSKALAASLKRPCIFTVPKISLRVLMGEGADLLLYGQFVIPQKLMDSGFTFKYADVQDALQHV